jgi:hypothetical protein
MERVVGEHSLVDEARLGRLVDIREETLPA